jgi:hypothetical protein
LEIEPVNVMPSLTLEATPDFYKQFKSLLKVDSHFGALKFSDLILS